MVELSLGLSKIMGQYGNSLIFENPSWDYSILEYVALLKIKITVL
jgi:hypothetical protein